MSIDHRSEAEAWLRSESVWESPDARSVPTMLAALTHAVLALGDTIAATTHPTASAGLAGNEGDRDE